MTDRLALPRRYRDQLEALLTEHVPGVEVWAYGSRVNGRSHEGSDLDLVLRSPTLEPLGDGYFDLIEAIEKSRIPILVQAHDWAMLPESFHREIEWDYMVVQKGAEPKPAGEWRTALWGELATLEYGKSLRDYDSPAGVYKVYGTNGQIGWHSEPLCSYASVIIGRKGAYRGVHYSPDPFFVIDTAFYLKPKVEMDTRWAYYELSTQDINGMDSGSAIPSTSREDFYGLLVQVPPLAEQRAIAHILGTLDDKIELNRRMNETLEAMAGAIFKDWFVDFGPVRAKLEGREPYLPPELGDLFPDRLVDSELGEIPEGWEVKRIEDIAERVAMGPFGSSIKVSTFVDKGIPIISGHHLNGTLLEDGDYRFITEDHAEKLAKSNVQRGDIIFTHAGSIGQASCIPPSSQFDRYVISQRQFYMRCDISKISPLFVVRYFKTPEGQHQLLANTSSTGVPSIARPVTYLRSIKLCVPPKAIWGLFDRIVRDFYMNAAYNTEESRALVAQRDALLPKLVSGEVRVGEAYRA